MSDDDIPQARSKWVALAIFGGLALMAYFATPDGTLGYMLTWKAGVDIGNAITNIDSRLRTWLDALPVFQILVVVALFAILGMLRDILKELRNRH